MTIATTPAALPLPSHRLARLRHELARLIDARERAEFTFRLDADDVYFGGGRAAERRADASGANLDRIERELTAVRRAIRATTAERWEVAR